MRNLIMFKGMADGTIVRSLATYDSMDAAEAAMYHEVWYATSEPSISGLICIIMDDAGIEQKREEWSRYVEPTAEPIEEG